MKRFLVLMLAIGMAGCATTPQPASTATTVTAPEAPVVEAPAPVVAAEPTNVLDGPPDGMEVRMNPAFRNGVYALGIVYIGSASDAWCEISPGASLTFVADGERLFLSSTKGSEGSRKPLDNGGVAEAAVYTTTPEFLARLANAQSVEVKLQGSRRVVERRFSPGNFESLRRFLAAPGG